ncbi:genghis khan [Carabus blaptoides fortunei]
MLYGETPFYAESLVETYGKIMNHKNCFDFPTDTCFDVTDEAKDLVRQLICSSDFRLGQNGIQDFKNHPWFVGVDWEGIRDSTAPYIPEVSSPTDTSNFDVDDTDIRLSDAVPPTANSAFNGLHLPFIGFSFTQGSCISDLGNISSHLPITASQVHQPTIIRAVTQDNAESERKMSPDGTRKLQDEINMLTKRNCELESQLRSLESNSGIKELHIDSMDGGGEAGKLREMEKLVRLLKQEKEEAQKEKQDCQEKLKLQDKELKDALSQRKLAMAEYAEVTDRLSELRQQKQKLSRQVRDKEEELETAMQKVDSLRHDIRKAEKLRRELEARIEEALAEAGKERKLRERSEEYCRQMQEESDRLRVRSAAAEGAATARGEQQEVQRLKQELEKLEVQFNESLGQQQTRYNMELSSLREQLHEAESHRDLLEREVQIVREKLDATRLESLNDSEQTIMELSRRHEREKALLLEDNTKLVTDIDALTESVGRLANERQALEGEYEELRNKKDAIAQWENQISEIIQWVSDEKDARGYLQALATKMTEELECLKHTGVSNQVTGGDKNWRNRRSQKLDKMELLNLQSSLQSELQAKQTISEDLSKTRSELIAAQKELRDFRQRYDALAMDVKRKEIQIRELQTRLESGDGFLERPSSQMSYLDQFLKETNSNQQQSQHSSQQFDQQSATGQAILYHGGSIESEEGDIEDNRALSIASSKSNLSEISMHEPPSPMSVKHKSHQFLVRTFSSPTKCSHCTSLMVGLMRQGMVCEVCGFTCHTACCHHVPVLCPVPADQTKRPLGIDPTRGIGTAYEGYVKVPKHGGVKKGWVRQFVVVCDFKLFLYDISPDRNALPSVHVAQVLDMRDPQFTVSSVRDSDVIHATKKDIPCIFRITTSLMDPPGLRNHTLMLADTESEKTKWVVALSELHRILKRNNLPNTIVFLAREILDNSVTITKSTMSGCIIDPDRLVLGAEEGLYCLDLDRSEIARIGEAKKIHQLEYIVEEQLLVVVSGKQRHVRLVPVRALDGDDTEWIKVAESKSCVALAVGPLRRQQQQQTYCLCVAIKRQNTSVVIVYEITRTKVRHQRIRDVQISAIVQSLQILPDGRMCVGHPSNFTIYSILGEHQHAISLLHPDNPLAATLAHSCIEAVKVVELPRGEYLLVFGTLAAYVDQHGRRTRDREIMYPAVPTAFSYRDGHLLVFSETHVYIFNCATGEWVQTLNIKRAKPLNEAGTLSVCVMHDFYHLLYLSNIHQRELINMDNILMHDRDGRSVQRPRRRFSLREGNRATRISTDRRSKLISAPTNFNHISHMGPGEGIQRQRLIDLPTSVETADQSTLYTAQSRVSTASMLSSKMAPLPPKQHSTDSTGRRRPEISNPTPITRPNFPPYNGAKRAAPPRPRDLPPSLPRSAGAAMGGGVVGGMMSDSGASLDRALTPVSVGSMSSLHDMINKTAEKSSPRHSIASNNSSNLSTPPSPQGDHHHSSSYDS